MEHAGVREWLAVFRQFVHDGELEWHEGYEQCCERTPGDATARLRQLLTLAVPPTALFCASDVLALRAMSVAWQLGFHLPEQLSIIGFDDIEQAAEGVPALTTVRQPVSLMAKEAVHLLRALMQGSSHEAEVSRRIVQPELIVRASCAPAP